MTPSENSSQRSGSSSSGGVWAIPLLLGLAAVCPKTSLAAKSLGPILKVTCETLAQAASGGLARVNCRLLNLGTAPTYWLREPIVLEGPVDKQTLYLYSPVDGERAENTLRFDRKPNWGILFHRVVHLERQSLANLVRIEAAESVRVSVLWNPPKDRSFPSRGDWVGQITMVYLDEESLALLDSEARSAASPNPRIRGSMRNQHA